MYCIKCGKEMPDDMKFCPHCGVNQTTGETIPRRNHQDTAEMEAAVTQSQRYPQPSYPSVPQNPYREEPRETKRWIPVLIGCGIGAVAVACLIFYLVDPLGVFSVETASTETVTTAANTAQMMPVEEEDEKDELDYGNLNGDYLLPEGSTRYYTRSELEKLDSRVLWYARNEMYAKHGKGFRTEELKRYFESKPWYVELYTADEFDDLPEQLNQYEKANEDLMTQIEEERNSPYLH